MQACDALEVDLDELDGADLAVTDQLCLGGDTCVCDLARVHLEREI
jgi:hypothetical protein